MSSPRLFKAYEYASYNILNEGRYGKVLPGKLFDSLKIFAGDRELPYYTITANGVRFCNYVGVIQAGKWMVEVLPKIDGLGDDNSAQKILVQMLNQSGRISINIPSESDLRLKKNYLLEAYIRIFLEETYQLFRRGLIKKYHRHEGNNNALKGNLVFSVHLRKNVVHREKFYINHTIYNCEHILNSILLKTLNVINSLPLSVDLISVSKTLAYEFPQLKDIIITYETFKRIKWDRKSEPYRKAIEIAKLLLMNYHPDIISGQNNVLALMFDMNVLWERWFAKRLKSIVNAKEHNIRVETQVSKLFWSSNRMAHINQKPDILITGPDSSKIILDTKWKIVHSRPSEDDLRQMFAYNRLFNSKKAYLIYPGYNPNVNGSFFDVSQNGECELRYIPFVKDNHLTDEYVDAFINSIV